MVPGVAATLTAATAFAALTSAEATVAARTTEFTVSYMATVVSAAFAVKAASIAVLAATLVETRGAITTLTPGEATILASTESALHAALAPTACAAIA